MDNEKVIKELHDARRYLEDKEWSDRGASPHIDAINDALAMLKEQEEQERKWLKSIADNQLANAPKDSPMSLDEQIESEYKSGICDGLQMAYEILMEGR